jgi:light-regulated signal transduction histidine kinase (bacteriophytochrome)
MVKDADLSEVMSRSDDVCAHEPIHLVGAIQPHGYLFGLDADDLSVVTRSANLDALVPLQPGARAADRLPAPLIEACRSVARDPMSERLVAVDFAPLGLTEFHCFRLGRVVFCEFEDPAGAITEKDMASILLMAEDAESRIAAAADVETLSATAAAAIAAISGFERVMVYRFDAEGCGDVLGESLVPDWRQSFLGLRFPATDIPAQARALYRLTGDRWIPTCDYEPVPLVPKTDGQGAPFALSLSRYRSVSPVHRLYQRNIGVDGSMSISIMLDGRLWGLIIGHHRRPHRVAPAIRHRVSSVARAFSLRLDALSSRALRTEQERELGACSAILSKLAAADDFLPALTEGKPDILDLLPGCIGAAVVWDKDDQAAQVRTLGTTPPDRDVADLVAWIRRQGTESTFASDCLAAAYPAFARHEEIASGVLACLFDDPRHPALLLFRPEVVRSVSWAGKPEKLAGADGIPNLPRRSFDRWIEVKHGHSQPWLDWERSMAATVAATVNDVIVRQMRRISDLDQEVSRFAQALALGSTTLYRQDRDLRYVWIHNPQAGLGRKALGLTDWEVYEPELAARIVAIKQRVLQSGQGCREAVPSRLNDPMAEWFDLSVEPLLRDDGTVSGLSCAGIRITERKRAEDTLRRNEALLRDVQATARLGHYVYDFASDRWESSPVLDSILGIGPDFVRDCANGFNLAAGAMRAETEALVADLIDGKRDFFDLIFQICRHDDHRERWVASIGHVERDDDGRPIRLIGTIHDIHERVEAQNQLQLAHAALDRQTRELARSNAELEQFAYVASHDMRQPLRSIAGFLSLLDRRIGNQLQDADKELLDFAIDGARRMDRLILDLLEYSRLGHSDVAMAPVDLEGLLADCLHALEAARAEAQGEIRVLNRLPTVLGHPSELSRLFQNLIGNALKYRDPERRPNIAVGCRAVGEHWEFRVEDNGIGIAEKDYDRAFGVFQRLVGSDRYEGTGIGLSVCKKVVERHGGHIWIESRLGRGTIFRFTLPKAGEHPPDPSRP